MPVREVLLSAPLPSLIPLNSLNKANCDYRTNNESCLIIRMTLCVLSRQEIVARRIPLSREIFSLDPGLPMRRNFPWKLQSSRPRSSNWRTSWIDRAHLRAILRDCRREGRAIAQILRRLVGTRSFSRAGARNGSRSPRNVTWTMGTVWLRPSGFTDVAIDIDPHSALHISLSRRSHSVRRAACNVNFISLSCCSHLHGAILYVAISVYRFLENVSGTESLISLDRWSVHHLAEFDRSRRIFIFLVPKISMFVLPGCSTWSRSFQIIVRHK